MNLYQPLMKKSRKSNFGELNPEERLILINKRMSMILSLTIVWTLITTYFIKWRMTMIETCMYMQGQIEFRSIDWELTHFVGDVTSGTDLGNFTGGSSFISARAARRKLFGTPWHYLEPPVGGSNRTQGVPQDCMGFQLSDISLWRQFNFNYILT